MSAFEGEASQYITSLSSVSSKTVVWGQWIGVGGEGVKTGQGGWGGG